LIDAAGRGVAQENKIRLIFTCCHPALTLEARVALTQRVVGGLTVLFLVFNEGYLTTGPDTDPVRPCRG
jgi:hypothetical protein